MLENVLRSDDLRVVPGLRRICSMATAVQPFATYWMDNLSRRSASHRSDHDAVVPAVTMAWTD